MATVGQVPTDLAPARGPAMIVDAPPRPLRGAIGPLLACAWRTAVLVGRRSVRQPRRHVGRLVTFADGTQAAIYRETVVDAGVLNRPAVLVVCFRLRHATSSWQHALFRAESELNTVLFAGFFGFASKLWLRHDGSGRYRGVYQWDGTDAAVAYARAVWWALAAVSEPGSIHYAVLPGLLRDELFEEPTAAASASPDDPRWWLPVRTRPRGRTPADPGGRSDSPWHNAPVLKSPEPGRSRVAGSSGPEPTSDPG